MNINKPTQQVDLTNPNSDKIISKSTQETHICKYCGAETAQSDDECYAKPISSLDWFTREEDKLFTSYQKGFMNTARYILLKHRLSEQAKAMHKEEIVKAAARGYLVGEDTIALEDAMNYGTKYYNETYNQNK